MHWGPLLTRHTRSRPTHTVQPAVRRARVPDSGHSLHASLSTSPASLMQRPGHCCPILAECNATGIVPPLLKPWGRAVLWAPAWRSCQGADAPPPSDLPPTLGWLRVSLEMGRPKDHFLHPRPATHPGLPQPQLLPCMLSGCGSCGHSALSASMPPDHTVAPLASWS